jgi:hypothetical protein
MASLGRLLRSQCDHIAIRLSLRESLRNPVILLGDVLGRTGYCAVVCYCVKRYYLPINHLVCNYSFASSLPLI